MKRQILGMYWLLHKASISDSVSYYYYVPSALLTRSTERDIAYDKNLIMYSCLPPTGKGTQKVSETSETKQTTASFKMRLQPRELPKVSPPQLCKQWIKNS